MSDTTAPAGKPTRAELLAALPTLKGGGRILGDDRDKLGAQLREAYEAGASIRTLHVTINRSYGFVIRLLKEADTQFRPRGGPYTKDDKEMVAARNAQLAQRLARNAKEREALTASLRELYESGVSLTSLTQQLDAPRERVKQLLEEAGTTFRTPAEQARARETAKR